MLIVNADGEYEYASETRTPKASDHPVYKARIELALGAGEWLYAPTSGHDLKKYETAKQTDAKIEEFQKDLAFYLEKYGPVVTDLLTARGKVSLNLQIAEDALNV